MARFLQVNPLHQGFSPYVYVGDMPDEFTDPTGMSAGDVLGSIFSILGGIAAIVGAVALTVLTAGAATGLEVGVTFGAGALIGGGVSSLTFGIQSAVNGHFSLGGWAIFGAAGGGIGMSIGTVGWSAGRTLLADVAANTALGAVEGVLTGGTGDIWKELGYGVLGGFVGSALLGAAGRGLSSSRPAAGNHKIGLVLTNRRHYPAHNVFIIGNGALDRSVTRTSMRDLLGSTFLGAKNPTRFGIYPEFNTDLSPAYMFHISRIDMRRVSSLVRKKILARDNIGDYNFFTNSCTSNIVDLLEAAGFRVLLYARMPSTLMVWAKGMGAIEGTPFVSAQNWREARAPRRVRQAGRFVESLDRLQAQAARAHPRTGTPRRRGPFASAFER